jgi:hypothetical protein
MLLFEPKSPHQSLNYSAQGLSLHHFYRAMARLGEELEEKPAGRLGPVASCTGTGPTI